MGTNLGLTDRSAWSFEPPVRVGPVFALRRDVRRPDDRERRTLQTLTTASGIGLAAACLLWVAIANGFPLCHSDTGTYVDSSFTWRVPPDRPVFHGPSCR